MSSIPETINIISRWLSYVFAIPMIIIGIVGAILTIIVFRQQRSFRKNPTINYLLSGAILTAIHLPTIYLQNILMDGFGYSITNRSDALCRQYNFLFYLTTVPTICYPCWAAFEQYATTSRDASYRARWSNLRVARRAILATIMVTIIIYLPMIFTSGVVGGACIIANDFYKILNNYILTPLIFGIGPLFLVILCAIGTIKNLRSSPFSYHNNHLTGQIRRMLVPQLIILVLSGIPYSILFVYGSITSKKQKDAVEIAIERLLIQIIRVFYHINFTSSFYIYLYKAREVRKVFRKTIHKYFSYNAILPSNSES